MEGTGTVICGTRYGNVMASRGSVIPLFVEQVLAGKPITITDPEHDALHDDAGRRGGSGAVCLHQRQQRRHLRAEGAGRDHRDAGARGDRADGASPRTPGEHHRHPPRRKLYEALLSRESAACAEDMGDYFRVPADGRDLNYSKFVDQGEGQADQTTHGEDYNSHNTTRLDVDGMTQLLLKLEGMQRIARGETTTVEEC